MAWKELPSRTKIGIFIGATFLVIAVVVVLVAVSSKSSKTPGEKAVENVQKIVNELESRSEAEKKSEQQTISETEAVIEAQLAGTNNKGLPYKKWYMVDRRYTADEEYFVTVRFNADELDNGEREQAKKKTAEILKALYTSNDKIAYIIVEAYTSQDIAYPILEVRLEKVQSDKVDWSQSVDKLYQDILPSVWSVVRGG